MKIYSNIRDYYDGVLKSRGNDPHCKLKREFKYVHEKYIDIKLPERIFFKSNYFNWPCPIASFNSFVLIMAGKPHFGIEYRMEYKDLNYTFLYDDEAIEFIKGFDVLDIYIRKLKFAIEQLNKMNFDELLIKNNAINAILTQRFFDFNSDVVKHSKHIKSIGGYHNAALFNVPLKAIGFSSVMDAESLANEVENYVCNVLNVPEKETVEVSDDVKIAQHGYDDWSFRNPDPPKRKQKKK